jgi:hypothetical protein
MPANSPSALYAPAQAHGLRRCILDGGLDDQDVEIAAPPARAARTGTEQEHPSIGAAQARRRPASSVIDLELPLRSQPDRSLAAVAPDL